MSAARWFQLRDRIDTLLQESLDEVVTDPRAQAYLNAVRTAAERLLSEFEISEIRSAGTELTLRLQAAPGVDHAAIARETVGRGPQFRNTEHARSVVSRRVFDTPMETTIVPIVVGWAHRTGVAADLLAMATTGNGRVLIVNVLRADDGLPGSITAARITFDLRLDGGTSRHDVIVSGADAKTALDAWNAR